MRLWIILGTLAAALAGAARAQTGTVITSDALTFDYKRSVAIFENNVKVNDPQMRMEADKLTLLFEGTNSIKSITATGKVKLWQADKVATCKQAVYVGKSGEITLTGDVVVTRGSDSLQTEEVLFWVNEDRMQCRKPSRVTISAESQSGGGKSPRALPFK